MSATLYDVAYWISSHLLGALGGLPASSLPGAWGVGATALAWLITAAVVFAASLVNILVLIWWERKLLGRFMDRRGAMHVGFAGLLQNLADGLKLFRKQVFSPREADPLGYYLAPTAYLITSIVLLGFLPVSAGFVAGAVPLSLLLALAIFSFAPLFIFVGSWSSNNKYSLIGGMRTAAQMVAYEIPLLLSVVSVVILSGSFDLGTIVQDQARDGWYGAPLILGLIVFSVAILAEIERIPFDLPEAEAELVEGWNTEYGGILFAMTMMTDYIRSLVGSYLVVLLFLGGWTLPTWGGLGILSSFPLSGILWFQVKTYIVFGVFVWVRAALPRVRTDQLLQIGWRRMLPLSLLNIAIAAGWVLAGWPHLTWPSV